ncbi:MAG: hypothetical protein DDT18_00967 [Actinobacteria bacterium]|nr:hypothetical protein [Actinomycetota bacterium]
MTITFYGEGCFKIQSGDITVLTDPLDDKTGLTAPRFKSDIILKTLTPLPIANSQTSDVRCQFISGPGEYNIKDINVTGFALPKESSEKFLKTVYLMKMEGINLCFLGHISEIPEPAILEHLEEIDILFIPAGGEPFINQKSAGKTVKQTEPKIVVPSFYKIPSLKRTASDISIFLEEFNGGKTKQKEAQEKLVIKRKDLTGIKKTEIVILKV